MRSVTMIFAFAAVVWLTGCGGNQMQPCVSSFSLGVEAGNPGSTPSQPTGTADHSLASPGNQQQFYALYAETSVSGDCALPANIHQVIAQWSLSDTVDASISSKNDTTNGLATCLGATLTPAIVTATYTQNGTTKTVTSTLTCK